MFLSLVLLRQSKPTRAHRPKQSDRREPVLFLLPGFPLTKVPLKQSRSVIVNKEVAPFNAATWAESDSSTVPPRNREIIETD